MTEEGKNTQQDAKLTMEELEGVSGGGHVPGVDYNPPGMTISSAMSCGDWR